MTTFEVRTRAIICGNNELFDLASNFMVSHKLKDIPVADRNPKRREVKLDYREKLAARRG